MNYRPKVSIIIPVYNGSNYMKNAIDSALAQTYDNCEIIVVNDGSTDNGESERIALSYGDKIKYYHKENGGVSSALNFAFSKMTGEWFSWLSHDDIYYPDKVQNQIEFINYLLVKYPNLNADEIIVRCESESIDKNGKVIKKPDYSSVPEKQQSTDAIVSNVKKYLLAGCTFLIPKKSIDIVGGFNEDNRTTSDTEFWYELLFKGYDFYFMKNQVLVQSRAHKQQVGKTKVKIFEAELDKLHIKFADKLIEMNPKNVSNLIVEFYKGLIYRHMKIASKYVKKTYIRKHTSWFKYYISLPISCGVRWFMGTLRNMARNIYRKLKVK